MKKFEVSINKGIKTIVCQIEEEFTVVGKSRCNPIDIFDLEAGMRIAEIRAKIKLEKKKTKYFTTASEHYDKQAQDWYMKALRSETRGRKLKNKLCEELEKTNVNEIEKFPVCTDCIGFLDDEKEEPCASCENAENFIKAE